ncbi:hypothetical protein DY000_02031905 [Brassica cretica]|uniref:Reverse transcriptase zinc-binding domain-containing protein n=1 Tax=Brassica cretica TaxID=69181 RepID=A0ABQ7DUI0_BRACR|nr:hypothetical protein DY000_02031905 [Brassica cretica]
MLVKSASAIKSARVFWGRYCHRTSFLRITPAAGSSHRWKGILAGRDLLLTNLGSVIGNGEETRVWRDAWISTTSPITPYGPVNECAHNLMVADLLCRESKEWNIWKIESVLPHLLPDILLLKPSITGGRDSYAWLASKSVDYSTKSGYFVATSLLNSPVGIDS